MEGALEIDFTSESNELLLNPRLTDESRKHSEWLLTQVDIPSSHVWLSTSGSTGHPKLAGIPKRALLASATAVNEHLAVTSSDTWGLSLPTFHVGGIGIVARSLVGCTRMVRIDSKWDPGTFHEALVSERVTLTSLVPTQVYDLVAKGIPAPPKLRAVVVGGGALAPEQYTQARALGWPVLPSFGMTETCSQIATASLASLTESLEYPDLELLPCFEVSTTVEGLLQISRGPLFSGYVIEENDVIRFDDPKQGGVFTSADRCEIYGPSNRFLRPLGRSGDIVKVKGENVSVSGIERAVRSALEPIPQIRDCAVLAIPHRRDGNALILFLEMPVSDSLANESIASRLASDLLPFERPADIVAVPSFPRSALGKIQRQSLLEMRTAHDN